MVTAVQSPEEAAAMRVAGRLAAEVLEMISEHVRPGVSTGELDRICHRYITEVQGCIPAPLHYQPSPQQPPFPKSICTSVNHVVCHGIPSDRKILKSGDIVNIDVTIIKDGFHGDTSKMFILGKGGTLAERLVRVTRECLCLGIAAVRPGGHLGDVGHAIQTHAEAAGFSVVREFCGHGIGRVFHGQPQVMHYGRPGTGIELRPGMTFTIEPMINAGRREVKLLADQWTVVTKDHQITAQWEHTILVSESGAEVLTRRVEETESFGAAA